MVCVIRICSPVIKVSSKGTETDVPKPTKLDFLDVLCPDSDILLNVSFQFIVSISAIHIKSLSALVTSGAVMVVNCAAILQFSIRPAVSACQ